MRPGGWLEQFENGFILVFAGNRHCAQEYERMGVPGKYVHSSLRTDILEEWWNHCNELRDKGKVPPKTLMIFDDVLVTASSKKYKQTRTSQEFYLNKIWSEGRHQEISALLSVQSMTVALPFVRCSDCFLCAPASLYAHQDIKMLTENYCPCDRKTALALSEKFGAHEFMCCDFFRMTSRNWRGRVFRHKVTKDIVRYESEPTGEDSKLREGPERPPDGEDDGGEAPDSPGRTLRDSPGGAR